ncbi:MAG: hypothetical protein UV38_C0002G0038 [candidate division TM6 bacterium GW2011_GWE2_42_60]|nr:MAG: hypothetical protein UV38_C0002G0038 [candidate division TM6 bacterium GW2011_GWE2_42_60]HBY06205.1 hypothetical protein [Candidatus Dependentiae bacterium]
MKIFTRKHCFLNYSLIGMLAPFTFLQAMNTPKKNLLLKTAFEQEVFSPLSPQSPSSKSSCSTPPPIKIPIPTTQIRWSQFLENCNAPARTIKLLKLYEQNHKYFSELIQNEKNRTETVFSPTYECAEKNKCIEYQKLNALIPRLIEPSKADIAVLWDKLLFVIPHEGSLSTSLFELALEETPTLLSWSPKNEFLAIVTENKLSLWSKESHSIFEKSFTFNGAIEKIVWAPNEKSLLVLTVKNYFGVLSLCPLSTKKTTKKINPNFKLLDVGDPLVLFSFDTQDEDIETLTYLNNSKTISLTTDVVTEAITFETKTGKLIS